MVARLWPSATERRRGRTARRRGKRTSSVRPLSLVARPRLAQTGDWDRRGEVGSAGDGGLDIQQKEWLRAMELGRFLGTRWGRGVIGLSGGLFVAAGVTVASAHTGGVASGVIHSCVSSASGEIKIVGATQNCKDNETALDWNAQGLQG